MRCFGVDGDAWRRRASRVLVLGCALFALACGGTRDRYERVVVVSVSSLRWDHLGANGYPRPTTPFLDELASQGVVFERAYAGSSRGVLSLTTLLTGLEPREHGLRHPEGSLAPEIPTLAAVLAERGFRTAAFVSYWSFFEPRGLARDFGHFDGPREFSEKPYRAADRTVDAALAWLEQKDSKEPLFLFLQLHDPTHPYRPPPTHLQAVVSGSSGKDYYEFLEREHGVPLGWYRWESAALNLTFNNYDAEVLFVDTELRRLRSGLEALGLLDGTLFVITSQHGAGLGNHFWDAAGQVLYEEQVHVPLIVAAADGSLAPRSVPDVVSHKDVMPTIVALLGGDAAADALAPPPSGRSLTPLLSGGTLAPRPAFFDRGEFLPLSMAVKTKLERSPNPPRPGPLLGGVDRRWKLLDYVGALDELYDLENDPFERENLLATGGVVPSDATELRKAVESRSPFFPQRAAAAKDR